jgi:ABC-type maltose transport system permease subunit
VDAELAGRSPAGRPANTFLSAMAAYAFSRLRFEGAASGC